MRASRKTLSPSSITEKITFTKIPPERLAVTVQNSSRKVFEIFPKRVIESAKIARWLPIVAPRQNFRVDITNDVCVSHRCAYFIVSCTRRLDIF